MAKNFPTTIFFILFSDNHLYYFCYNNIYLFIFRLKEWKSRRQQIKLSKCGLKLDGDFKVILIGPSHLYYPDGYFLLHSISFTGSVFGKSSKALGWTQPPTRNRSTSTFLKPIFRMLQGFHIITYALHIYYLNLFIAFLTPKVEPMTYDDEDDEDAGSLPTSNQSEFKPFIRRLPEFKVTIYHFNTKINKNHSFGGGQHVPQLWHLHVLSLNFSMYQYSGRFWSCILLCSSLLR